MFHSKRTLLQLISLEAGLLPALLVLLVAAQVRPAEACAQLPIPRLEVSPYAGRLFASDLELEEFEDGSILGARLRLALVRGLALEGQVGYAPLEATALVADQSQEFDVRLWLYEAGLTYSLPLPGPLTPFLGAAVGQTEIDSDLELDGGELEDETKVVASAGVGLRLSVPFLGLRADLRDHVVFDALEETSAAIEEGAEGETLHAVELSVGLSFRLF